MISRILKLVAAVGLLAAVGAAGSFFTAPAIESGWYAALTKPPLTPPAWLFGPVWTALYLLIALALYLVWARGWRVRHPIFASQSRPWNRYSERLWMGSWQKGNAVAIFAIQLFLNVLWSGLFFGLGRPDLAFFEILALWFAILYTIINFYRVSRAAAYWLVPYLLWVSFAAYLNLAIWLLNY